MAEMAARQIHRSRLLGFFLVVFVHLLGADASVHEYAGGKFVAKGNAFVFHGGSEGLFASVLQGEEGNGSSPAAGSGDSFIR